MRTANIDLYLHWHRALFLHRPHLLAGILAVPRVTIQLKEQSSRLGVSNGYLPHNVVRVPKSETERLVSLYDCGRVPAIP